MWHQRSCRMKKLRLVILSEQSESKDLLFLGGNDNAATPRTLRARQKRGALPLRSRVGVFPNNPAGAKRPPSVRWKCNRDGWNHPSLRHQARESSEDELRRKLHLPCIVREHQLRLVKLAVRWGDEVLHSGVAERIDLAQVPGNILQWLKTVDRLCLNSKAYRSVKLILFTAVASQSLIGRIGSVLRPVFTYTPLPA